MLDDESPRVDAPELERLAANLREISANLEAYIQDRAEAIAAPRIAKAEAEIERLHTEHKRNVASCEQRYADMQGEVQRQFTALERQVAQGGFLAQFLPANVWSAAGITRYEKSQLRPSWVNHVMQCADEAGLSLDTERQQREGAPSDRPPQQRRRTSR
ncbi:hypothetical protein [Natronoglycomyces albus]|uniref:Uncharacterized protein n=1 Tax=Natronoglycomyces albus TaxID=2811108 RepID=A0A895XPB5_9ACTN|nr:hypothetical protein [Natronoglycomyces albus]QSB07194.1 hypothetical protein JQS30_16960 [Natronoglycomyces albus]